MKLVVVLLRLIGAAESELTPCYHVSNCKISIDVRILIFDDGWEEKLTRVECAKQPSVAEN